MWTAEIRECGIGAFDIVSTGINPGVHILRVAGLCMVDESKAADDQGVRVFRAVEGSVKQNPEYIKSNKLPEFSVNRTCAGHQGQGGCQHH